MAKWREIQDDIESQLADSEWTTHNIATYPANFQGEITDKEFVRINILPGLADPTYGGGAVNEGAIIISVFAPSGEGSKRVYEICDHLDDIYQNQTFDNGTQTFASTVQLRGIDRDNAGLYRVNYTIPFRYYS